MTQYIDGKALAAKVKAQVREEAAKRAAFCLRLAMRIAKESPEWAKRCADVENLQQYFHPLRQPIDV